MRAHPADTVRSLKQRVQEVFGIPGHKQLLNWGSVKLEPEERDEKGNKKRERLLSDYGLRPAEPRHTATGPKVHVTDFTALRRHHTLFCRIEKVECRGITVLQLRQMMAFLRSMCFPESQDIKGWLDERGKSISLFAVDMRGLVEWVARPATSDLRCSYVEFVSHSVDAQKPTWFVSHCWRDPAMVLFQCLDEHLTARGLHRATAYWLAGFAHRHCEQGGATWKDPRASVAARAIRLCHGLLLVMDGEGRALRRTWCCFEQLLAAVPDALRRGGGVPLFDVAVYDCTLGYLHVVGVAGKSQLHLLTEGLRRDESEAERSRGLGWGWRAKAAREAFFPTHVRDQALAVDIMTAKASVLDEQELLLRAVAKLTSAPSTSGRRGTGVCAQQRRPVRDSSSTSSDEEDELALAPSSLMRANALLRARFASLMWAAQHRGPIMDTPCHSMPIIAMQMPPMASQSSCPASPRSARSIEANATALCEAMRGAAGLGDLRLCLGQGSESGDLRLQSLAGNLPPGLRNLELYLGDCDSVGAAGVNSLAASLPPRLEALVLDFWRCPLIDDAALREFAMALRGRKEPLSLKVLRFCLGDTPVTDEGVYELSRCLPPGLTELELDFSNARLGDFGMLEIGRALPAQLTALHLGLAHCAVTDSGVAQLALALPPQLQTCRVDLSGTGVQDGVLRLASNTEGLHVWQRWLNDPPPQVRRRPLSARMTSLRSRLKARMREEGSGSGWNDGVLLEAQEWLSSLEPSPEDHKVSESPPLVPPEGWTPEATSELSNLNCSPSTADQSCVLGAVKIRCDDGDEGVVVAVKRWGEHAKKCGGALDAVKRFRHIPVSVRRQTVPHSISAGNALVSPSESVTGSCRTSLGRPGSAPASRAGNARSGQRPVSGGTTHRPTLSVQYVPCIWWPQPPAGQDSVASDVESGRWSQQLEHRPPEAVSPPPHAEDDAGSG